MAIGIDVKIDAKDLLANLKKIAKNSSDSLQPIVHEMAESTQRSARNILGVHRNSGELENSIKVTDIHQGINNEESIVYPTAEYAKFVHEGTSGMWTTSVNDSRLNASKMSKYGVEPQYYSFGDFKGQRYQFHGQKENPFMRKAFETTKDSNISFSKSKYIEYLLKGIR